MSEEERGTDVEVCELLFRSALKKIGQARLVHFVASLAP
jgi:hypothetical protein